MTVDSNETPIPLKVKKTQPCSYCDGVMEKCGNGWYCRNPECGFNYVVIKRTSKSSLIERTKNWGITRNPEGKTITMKMRLSFEGSVSNVIRSNGKDSWGVKEACRLYTEGRDAWLRGDFETVADLFGILI